jgi:MFS family permease
MDTPSPALPSPGLAARSALFLGLVFKASGMSLAVILLPPLGRRMGFSDLETGMVMSISALAGIVMAPVWGMLTESIGRKPVLLLGLFAPAACLALTAVLVDLRFSMGVTAGATLAAVFVIRLFQTGFSGSVIPAAQAHMADTTHRRRRVQGMGFLGASFGLGAILGGTVAWRIGGEAPALSFALVAALLLLAATGAWLYLPETAPPRDRTASTTGTRVNVKGLWPHFLVTLLAVAAYGVMQQVMAIRLQDYYQAAPAQSVSQAGSILAAASVCMILVQGVVIWKLDWTPQAFLVRGSLLAMLALLGVWAAPGHVSILISMMIFGAGLGLLFPGNLGAISLQTRADGQGRAAGINAVFQGFGMACGPILGALLNALSFGAAPAFCAATFLVAAILGARGPELREPETELARNDPSLEPQQ